MERIEVKEMPSQEVLEAFLGQIVLGHACHVVFNAELGVFEETKHAEV